MNETKFVKKCSLALKIVFLFFFFCFTLISAKNPTSSDLLCGVELATWFLKMFMLSYRLRSVSVFFVVVFFSERTWGALHCRNNWDNSKAQIIWFFMSSYIQTFYYTGFFWQISSHIIEKSSGETHEKVFATHLQWSQFVFHSISVLKWGCLFRFFS